MKQRIWSKVKIWNDKFLADYLGLLLEDAFPSKKELQHDHNFHEKFVVQSR